MNTEIFNVNVCYIRHEMNAAFLNVTPLVQWIWCMFGNQTFYKNYYILQPVFM